MITKIQGQLLALSDADATLQVDAFDAQDDAYRESVLPSGVKARVAVEAGVTDYWLKYVGLEGKVIGLDTFGESAPAPEVYKHFGITAENVAAAVEELL